MSARGEMTRREFLVSGAAAGSTLVIGIHFPGAQRLEAAAAPLAPNAWLSIGSDGVATLVLDKSEMGQGTHTGLAIILADELDVQWSAVRLAPVPENPAGWQRRMATGGSTAIHSSWDALRKAGAQARTMLVQAAAATWAVEPATCTTESGAVVHAASRRRLRYAQLVEKAATLPVPENPTLKSPKDFRLIGTRVARLDTPSKVNGTAKFGIDVKVPGMLVASVLRSPVFGGKVKRLDAAKTRALPGVRHVVELPANTAPSTDGQLQNRTESAVAVAADTYWQAVQGRQALIVDWDEGPNASLSSADIRSTFVRLAAEPGVVARKDGDAAAALSGAAKKIEATYEVPYLHHATMEPMNATAHVRSDGCDVWVPTQNQTRAQEVAAAIAGLPKERVRIHTTLLGGGFGRRLESDFVAEAVSLSKAIGAPVKIIWSREDDTQHGFYRPATYNRLAAGVDASGRPVAWTHHIVAPSILLPKFGPLRDGIDATSVDGASDLPYAIPNLSVSQVVADVPVPLGFWRSVGASQNTFVVECFFDELAALAGRDPYELRRELLREKPRHLRTLELAAQKAGWGSPLPPGRARGIAITEWSPSVCAQVVEVSVAAGGAVRVHRVVCAVDCGPAVNIGQIEAQMEGGVVYGLSAALYGEITIEKGRVQQGNFNDYPMLRIGEMPVVETYVVPSTDKQGGIGEPSVPPIAPAVCNAIFAATGKQVRKLPVRIGSE